MHLCIECPASCIFERMPDEAVTCGYLTRLQSFLHSGRHAGWTAAVQCRDGGLAAGGRADQVGSGTAAVRARGLAGPAPHTEFAGSLAQLGRVRLVRVQDRGDRAT